MTLTSTTRVDLHCHSTASQLSKLGIQRALGLPECATPPEEVYELAKRRGMDFVTITDHDTIAGVQQIADRSDVFVSEELTAWFKGEPQAVHVLCYAIAADDHEWLQAHADDVEQVAEYLHDHEIACALAHPFYAVEASLTPRHRRRLAQLFGVWETRNGSRAGELNAPAAVYIETHGGTGVAGSDDHAGIDVGRTFTETPVAHTWHELKLAVAVDGVVSATTSGGDLGGAAGGLFDACVAAIPYAPAAAFLGREKGKLAQREGDPLRVALVADAVGGMHGVTHTLDEIRERGVPGFEVEVGGTDANVDRRLSAVAELDIPFYAGLKVGVPSLPAIVEALAEGRYDLVHLCSPGPAGVAAAIIARIMDLPILGSYHTELA